jgi:myo-inositol-1-phosphate synthase
MGTDPAQGLLILVAGAKGAIGSTLAAASVLLRRQPEAVAPYLTAVTGPMALVDGTPTVSVTGWDVSESTMTESLRRHGVVPESRWAGDAGELDALPVFRAPDPSAAPGDQVAAVAADIRSAARDGLRPVFVNLLPACPDCGLHPDLPLDRLLSASGPRLSPDIVYTLGAIRCGVPVVNFTPNEVAIQAVRRLAEDGGVPMAGRDGKTGQTYLKVVLASALQARNLVVDGWYSLNILGNADGRNLMDPACAAGKLSNKTDLLDDLLGYPVGGRYGAPSHKVHIDYYPPRGDAKEAWDVIDIRGLFDMPMSIRLNLQGRDSILAAPMAIDLACWMAAAKDAGVRGLVPELGFFFKKPEGDDPPLSFQDQLERLKRFGDDVRRRP